MDAIYSESRTRLENVIKDSLRFAFEAGQKSATE